MKAIVSNLKFILLAAGLALAMNTAHAQDHGHLNAGAVGWNQGDQATWANGAGFLQSSGYVKTLNLNNTPTAKYFGFYDGNITLTALHHTNGLGENLIGTAAAPGSFFIGEIVSVEGPDGGAFGFWETNSVAGAPTFSIPSGTTDAQVKFDLSQLSLGAGSPGGDPFGHIHGRRMSATKPGFYTVGFRAIDVSVNGAGGGPIHTPTDILKVNFQAGYNIKTISWQGNVTRITVATTTGFKFLLQSNLDLNNPQGWTDVGSVTGNDLLQEIVDENAHEAARYYQVIVTPVAP